MTLTLFIIYKQHQIFLSIIFKKTTKTYKNVTESDSNEQMSAFISSRGSSENSTIQAFFQIPQPVFIKNQDGKFYMTFIFLETNDSV